MLSPQTLSRFAQWTALGRALVFVLAAASIWCLLAEMYGLIDMQTFFFAVLLPATAALYGIALWNRARGDRVLWRAVMIGTAAGLVAAAAYDVFRLPFVFSQAWNLERFGIPEMPLFKVFPRFGAMILGQPVEQPAYSLAAHLLGWGYHFSNGATFGVMFAALVYNTRPLRIEELWPRWSLIGWGALMALGIELCLLASPYSGFFQIEMTARFIAVTLIAHLVFGIAMGWWFAWHRHRCSMPAAFAT